MISAKEAVAISSSFLADLLPESRDHRLEQIASNRPNQWEVVLSFQQPSMDQPGLIAALNGQRREFKAVEVDRESGEPLALKVWKM